MTFATSNLGELEQLARAIGLINGNGFNDDWLSHPGQYLASVLADDNQRNSLLKVVDDLLCQGKREIDERGQIWLPLFESADPPIMFNVVIDDQPSDHVGIGLGVKLNSTNPKASASLHIPLFKAARTGHSVDDVLLLGKSGGIIDFGCRITVDSAPPVPGQAHISAVGLALQVPTDGTAPDFGLSVFGLQLPGATQPRDIVLSLAHLNDLESIALDLVLGLIEAQARQAASGALLAFARLIGLVSDTPIPMLPLDQLAQHGVSALATWAASVFGSTAANAAWLGALSDLLQNGAYVSAGRLELPIGSGLLTFAVDSAEGHGGLPVVVPTLGIEIGSGQAIARVEAKLFKLDLGTGAAVALPALEAFGQFGKTATGGTALLAGDPSVDAIRFGLSLDVNRRPAATLALINVKVGSHPPYPVLDLSSPQAVIQGAGQVIGDVLDQVLSGLGPAQNAIRVLLGLSVPAGVIGVTATDFATFLGNPLASVRNYWRELILNHAGAVNVVFEQLRNLIVDQGKLGAAIDGDGTPTNPWTIELVGPLELHAWRAPGSNRIEIAVAASARNDTLGQGCTRLDADLAVGLAAFDLDAGGATFLNSVSAGISGRVRGLSPIAVEVPPLKFSVDRVALNAKWTPTAGLKLSFAAPNPRLSVNGAVVPFDLPDLSAGFGAVTPAQWDAIEFVIGHLAHLNKSSWMTELVDALGWAPDVPGNSLPRRLRLADLIANPSTEALNWIRSVVLSRSDYLEGLLQPLARVFTGSGNLLGQLVGSGRPNDPFRVPLSAISGSPALALWLEPNGASPFRISAVTKELRQWRPGMAGLSPDALKEALFLEATAGPEVAAFVSGREDLGTGLRNLVQRWVGTDGRIQPPGAAPDGVVVHTENESHAALALKLDLADMLATIPDTIVHVAIGSSATEAPWSDIPNDRLVDLTQPNLVPAAFMLPVAATGDWYVVLGLRAACKLTAGDADGVGGQTARLQRVVETLGSLGGGIAIVAEGGAGHAARRVAEIVPEVSALVTVGTPLGVVSFSVASAEPAASTLHLLNAMMPGETEKVAFDDDLALGRDLVRGLLDFADSPVLADELAPPAQAPAATRVGLEVHALFGQLDEADIWRGLTAIVAAGLSTRAVSRAAFLTVATGLGCGIALPISLGGNGIIAGGQVALELLGFDLATPALRQTRPINLHLEIRRANGWLIGGPASTSGQDLRWVEFNLMLPLNGNEPASAEVILHEPRVFSVRRDRWVVRATATDSDGIEVVTTTLPEVGILLSGVFRELSLDPDPQIALLLKMLEACGLFARNATNSGFVTSALDSILHQPRQHFEQLIATPSSMQALQQAITAILAPTTGLTIDLVHRRFNFALAGTPGTLGLLPWSIAVSASSITPCSGELRLGAPGACLKLNFSPLTAVLEWPKPGQPSSNAIQVWPKLDTQALTDELPSILISSAMKAALTALRQLDAGTTPVIDALLDAAGFLSGVAGDANRAVHVPAALISAPAAYFSSSAVLGGATGLSPAKAIAFVDALKSLMGLNGAAGQIKLANGAVFRVASNGSALQVGLTLDGSAFAQPAGNPPRLAFGGAFGLTIAQNGTLRPVVDIFAGLPGAAAGRSAVHLAVADQVQLFIRPPTGSDISLYPNPPGLGAAATGALQVLPFVLDKIAQQTAPPVAATAANVVGKLGDALDLRVSNKFDSNKLAAWAANPSQRFADRLPAILQTALTELAAALGPALPTDITVSAPTNHLQVSCGPVAVDFTTAPFSAEVRLTNAAIPPVGNVSSAIAFDATGLKSFTGELGPGVIPVNGISLRPFVNFAAGNNPQGGARLEIGHALDNAGTDTVFGRWNISGKSFSLVSKAGSAESSTPTDVALAVVKVVLDVVARYAFAAQPVKQLLDKAVPHTSALNVKVKTLFRGVFLEDVPNPAALDAGLFDPAQLLGRFKRLLGNVADAGPNIDVGGGIAIGMRKNSSQVIELTLLLNGRVNIVSGAVTVALEADSRWIDGTPSAGLAIGFLDVSGPAPVFKPTLAVNGIGIRIGKSAGPLLDSGVKLGSIAVHFYADISQAQLAGGVQIQLSDLAVGASGASGGNPVAQGIMGDTKSGSSALAPKFSPALAVQKSPNKPVLVSLSAGDGSGPWWLSIQKGFGPLYIEQVGFGVTVQQSELKKIAILFDGRVAIAGLVASVDDLQITYTVASGVSFFDASHWAVDLAGLAVSADIAGVTLSGGLRKFETPPDPLQPNASSEVEYIGMLMARVATYGLSIYGGYGTGVSDGNRFTAFFAFGAVTGPIGGPPAFFLTGIGGGLGINRDLIFPENLQSFADFVMIKALDPAAKASDDPMQELVKIRDTFKMRRGRFWFAAGISFTSFALVDGIAVVAVSFGDGFELTLLGLARMALPRPQLRLVSIELALIVRFSTREGVLWIQAELTQNSWLLNESVRLTGGFAYVMWFDGERKGEFVLTLGGYHPNFHRTGYPQVPRLGFHWQVSDFISIKGENYFALTSEALMAGGAMEVAAKLGPAWANISYGADVIIYFDPFYYEAEAHARISAGITIDLWLGEVTISVSLGARIFISGPEFHGKATFEVGPVELTVPFGGPDKTGFQFISWDAFVNKYLEAASPGVARVLTSLPGRGTAAPGTGASGSEAGTADGSADHPHEVYPEFELNIASTAPATSLEAGAAPINEVSSGILGIAPLGVGSLSSAIVLTLAPYSNPANNMMGLLELDHTTKGAFPIGAWGPAQSREDKKIPQGEVINALNGALFKAKAALKDTIPAEVNYNQVETGNRKPLPFVTELGDRSRVLQGAKKLTELLPFNPTKDEIFTIIKPWMALGGNSPLALAALNGDRSAPPLLGALGERMAVRTPDKGLVLALPDAEKTVDTSVKAPQAIGLLAALARRESPVRRTTVKADYPRSLPPSTQVATDLMAKGLAAKLLRVNPRVGIVQDTLIASRSVAMTRQGRIAPAASHGRGADAASGPRLKALSSSLQGDTVQGSEILAGEIAVFALPNAKRDSGLASRPALEFKGKARIAMISAGGAILSDVTDESGAPDIPKGTERLAVWASPSDPATGSAGLSGWLDNQSLAYIGWSTCLCAGGSLQAESGKMRRGPESFTTGWITARQLLGDSRLVATRFTRPAQSLIVALDEHFGSGSDFSIALRGASIAKGGMGKELAPVLLSQGARRLLVYSLTEGESDFTVEILRAGAVNIVGVMSSQISAEVVAARLAQVPVDTMLEVPLGVPGGHVALRFVERVQQDG